METPIRHLPVRFRRIPRARRVAQAMRDNPAFEGIFGEIPECCKARPASYMVTMPDGQQFPAGAKFIDA